MATIKSFEDIAVWQKARIFSNKIFALTCIGSFSKDYSRKYITDEEFLGLKDEAVEMISGFMTYFQNTPIKGSKFHEPSEVYHNGNNHPIRN
jgi:hypothetical protein